MRNILDHACQKRVETIKIFFRGLRYTRNLETQSIHSFDEYVCNGCGFLFLLPETYTVIKI